MVAEIIERGGRACAAQADVSRSEDARRLVADTVAALGRLDILVNNAGVFSFQALEDMTETEYRRQFDTNVLGVLHVTQAALSHLQGRGSSIINIGSVASTNPRPQAALYAASKGAVDAMTMALARELGPRGIRVNVIAPGGVETEGTHANGLVGSDGERAIVAATPLARFGQPDDIARVAAFLASDNAGWITGERICVSGGWY